jgi:hypothetical protein
VYANAVKEFKILLQVIVIRDFVLEPWHTVGNDVGKHYTPYYVIERGTTV